MHIMLRVPRFASNFFIIVALPIIFANCSGEQAPLSWEARFVSLGAEVHFDSVNRRKIQRIRVFNVTQASNLVVAEIDLEGYPRRMESLYFRWEKGTVYRFEITDELGALSTSTLHAPQFDRQGSIEIAVPYGVVREERRVGLESASSPIGESLVLHGSEMTMTLLVRNGLKAPAEFQVKLEIPTGIEVLLSPDASGDRDGFSLSAMTPDGNSDKKRRLSASGRFTVESEVWYQQVELYVPADPLPDSIRISGSVLFKTVSGESWERQTSVSLRTATIDEIAALISIDDVLMPTNSDGVFDPRQRPDTISYSQPVFGRFGKWLGVKAAETNYFQPVSHQSLRLRNKGQNTVHLLVSAVNRDAKTSNPVPFLAPPDQINAGTARSLAFASLAPQSSTDVPLPIFFNPAKTEDTEPPGFSGRGRYVREIEVKVWGSDATVLRVQRPLYITTPNRQALIVTVFAFASTISGFILLFSFNQSIFARFSTKQLILVALFGTTIFVAVSIPSTLLANLISALLGPASFLITGLINEMLYYALLTTLLMLIPKPGVIALASIVRLLLGGVVLGLFNPMALVYTGVSILLLEAGFQIARQGRHLLLLATVFGVCDAVAVYVDFQLSMTLYRLFYANWFITARILVDGFAYTFIGVLLGRRLGWGLWRVAE